MPLPRTPFLFTRHGQTDHNMANIMSGSGLAMLTEKGREQAKKAGEYLIGKGVTRIVTSPLPRAEDTANFINQSLGVPIEHEPDLREIMFGSWEGRSYFTICEELGLNPDSFDYLKNLPADGDSWQSVQTRTANAVRKHLLNHPHDTILFVAHLGIYAALHELLTGELDEPENGKPMLFEPTPGNQWRITSF